MEHERTEYQGGLEGCSEVGGVFGRCSRCEGVCGGAGTE